MTDPTKSESREQAPNISELDPSSLFPDTTNVFVYLTGITFFITFCVVPFYILRVGRWSLIVMLKLFSKWIPVKHEFTRAELKSLYWIYFWITVICGVILPPIFRQHTAVVAWFTAPVFLWLASTMNWVKLDITSNDPRKQAVFAVSSAVSMLLYQIVSIMVFIVCIGIMAVFAVLSGMNISMSTVGMNQQQSSE